MDNGRMGCHMGQVAIITSRTKYTMKVQWLREMNMVQDVEQIRMVEYRRISSIRVGLQNDRNINYYNIFSLYFLNKDNKMKIFRKFNSFERMTNLPDWI